MKAGRELYRAFAEACKVDTLSMTSMLPKSISGATVLIPMKHITTWANDREMTVLRQEVKLLKVSTTDETEPEIQHKLETLQSSIEKLRKQRSRMNQEARTLEEFSSNQVTIDDTDEDALYLAAFSLAAFSLEATPSSLIFFSSAFRFFHIFSSSSLSSSSL